MQIHGLSCQHIASAERAFHYGDGHFTTCKVVNGRIPLLSLHLARLAKASHALMMPFSLAQLLPAVKQAAQQIELGVLKIVVSRGVSSRGYQPADDSQTQVYFFQSEIPSHYQQWQQQGISVGLSPVLLATQSQLVGLKTLNRLEQVMVKRRWPAGQWQDVLVTCSDNKVHCGSAANFLYYLAGQWYTPTLKQHGIHGVVRQRLLDAEIVQLRDIRVQELLDVDSAIMANSLMGLVPVAQLFARPLTLTPALTFIDHWSAALQSD